MLTDIARLGCKERVSNICQKENKKFYQQNQILIKKSGQIDSGKSKSKMPRRRTLKSK